MFLEQDQTTAEYIDPYVFGILLFDRSVITTTKYYDLNEFRTVCYERTALGLKNMNQKEECPAANIGYAISGHFSTFSVWIFK